MPRTSRGICFHGGLLRRRLKDAPVNSRRITVPSPSSSDLNAAAASTFPAGSKAGELSRHGRAILLLRAIADEKQSRLFMELLQDCP